MCPCFSKNLQQCSVKLKKSLRIISHPAQSTSGPVKQTASMYLSFRYKRNLSISWLISRVNTLANIWVPALCWGLVVELWIHQSSMIYMYLITNFGFLKWMFQILFYLKFNKGLHYWSSHLTKIWFEIDKTDFKKFKLLIFVFLLNK